MRSDGHHPCRNRTASSVISEDDLPLCDIQIGQRDRNQPEAQDPRPPVPVGAARVHGTRQSNAPRRDKKEGRMLQSSENSFGVRSTSPASNPNSYNPVKTTTAPVEQATIGRSLVIKGEISGS